MSKMKDVLVLVNGGLMGILSSSVFVPFFTPQLVGTLGAYIATGLCTLMWILIFYVALWMKSSAFIAIINAVFVAALMVLFLGSFFPQVLAAPAGILAIIVVTIGWSTILWILLYFVGREGKG